MDEDDQENVPHISLTTGQTEVKNKKRKRTFSFCPRECKDSEWVPSKSSDTEMEEDDEEPKVLVDKSKNKPTGSAKTPRLTPEKSKKLFFRPKSVLGFLLELLLNQQNQHVISWTDENGEFKMHQPKEVARLWGLRKDKTNMKYSQVYRAIQDTYHKV